MVKNPLQNSLNNEGSVSLYPQPYGHEDVEIVSAPARACSLRKGINPKTINETADSEPQESNKICRTNVMILGEFGLFWKNRRDQRKKCLKAIDRDFSFGNSTM